jgi:hypothetical protein
MWELLETANQLAGQYRQQLRTYQRDLARPIARAELSRQHSQLMATYYRACNARMALAIARDRWALER